MKKAILLTLILTLLNSCSQKTEEELGLGNSPTSGNRDIQAPPSNPNDPNQPPNTGQPPSAEVTYAKLQYSDIADDELKEMNFPYNKKTGAKPYIAGKTEESKKCEEQYIDKCVDRKQVHFHFNLEDLKKTYAPELWSAASIELEASYYSHKKNDKTELICLLNIKRCSGKIIYHNNSKFSSAFAKLLWINKDFWEKEKKENLKNQLFTDRLESSLNETGDTYIAKDVIFSLQTLFEMDANTLDTMIRKNTTISFVVSDDTFVEDPVLTIKFIKKVK